MNRPAIAKILTVTLIATLATAPVYADCTRCCNNYSPPVCDQLLYDNYFMEGCAWSFSGSTQVNNGAAELSGFGDVSQEVTVPTGRTSLDLQFDLDVVPGTDEGTERLVVEIIASGTTIIDTFYGVASDGHYQYSLGDYHGQTVTIRFRYAPHLEPGDTVYRVDNVVLFAC
jgi:hypothetical protein